MVEPVAVAVFRDVAVDEPDLVAFDGRGFRRSILAMAERLHFRAGQLNPGFEAVLDEIIETRARSRRRPSACRKAAVAAWP